MRIMAIDYGDAHTGVALSDLTGSIAGYTTVIDSWRQDVVLDRLGELIEEYAVTEIVLGSGTSGAPPSTPTTSSSTPGRTAKSGKKWWMPWRRR